MNMAGNACLVALLTILVVSTGTAPVHGQKRNKQPSHEAVKFDEFGSLGHCDLTARLDNFAITLQATPTCSGHIVYYGPDESGREALENISDYLVNMRGIPADRIASVYGGLNDDLKKPRIQLWAIPAGAMPPEIVKYKDVLQTFTGMFDEHQASDGVEWGESEVGPGIGGTAYRSFEQMLLKRKSTLGYIVAFNGQDAAPGAWRRVATADFEDLTKAGIQPTRLRMVYGGFAKETKVQWWITSIGDPPPVKDGGEEPLPEKTVMLGSFVDAQLAEAKSERWALNSILEQLQRDESLRTCIVVKIESEKEEAETEESSTAEQVVPVANVEDAGAEYTDPDDSAARKVAILKLVEKWKVELATTHKIRADRVVVLFGEVPKYFQNTIETWIVPKGQPLPDPNAPAKEAAEAEEQAKTDQRTEKP